MPAPEDREHFDNAETLAGIARDIAGADLGDEADDVAVDAKAMVELATGSIQIAQECGLSWDQYREKIEIAWCIVQADSNAVLN